MWKFWIMGYTHQNLDLKTVKQAVDSIRHRGPDDEDYLLFNSMNRDFALCGGDDSDPGLNLPELEEFTGQDFDLAFGFRRLSILDLSPKHILRKAIQGIVPDPILERSDKIGFATPKLIWLRQLRPWVENILCGDVIRRIGVFNCEEIVKNFQDVLIGKRYFDFRFWRWINFVCWAERFNTEF